MIKNIRNIIFAVISLAIFSLAPITNTYAATPTFGHKYVNGVGNIAIWLDYSSGVGYWQSYITNAANNWMYPGWSNPIYTHFVSSNYGSNMDFYLRYNSFWGGSGILAETRFYNSGGSRVYPDSSNWSFVNIYINDDSYKLPYITNDMALGTTIHEMGHAWGLAHTTNVYSIMCQTGAGRVVQRVQQADNDAVNIIY